MLSEKMPRLIVETINKISRVGIVAGVVFMLAMMLLTVSDVFLRYVLNNPILGSVELSEYLMVCTGFLGIAWCAVLSKHVRVDLIVARFSQRTQSFIDSTNFLIILTVLPLLVWQSFLQAQRVMELHNTSDFLEIPDFPFYILVGVSYAMLLLVVITILVKSLISIVKR